MTLRTAEVFKCAQCSATLPIEASTEVAICPYCGTHNRVAPVAAPVPAPAPLVRTSSQPFSPAPDYRDESAAKTGGSSGLVVGVIAFVLLLAGGIVLATRGRSESSSPASTSVAPTQATQDPRTAQGLWWNQNALCLGDVNGDGVRDVVGITSGAQLTVVAVDGVSGKYLWTTPMADASVVLCAGDVWPVIGREKFLVSGLDPKTGKQTWETKLSDEASTKFSAGPGCLKLVTRDNAVHLLSAGTGKPVDACATTSAMDSESESTKSGAWAQGVTIEGTVIRITQTSGTARFQLDATKGGKSAWSKKLEVSPYPYQVAVPTSDGLVVLGSVPGDSNTLVWTYVRASDGEVVYRKEKPTDSQVDIQEAALDGDRVFFHVEERLMAVERKTGNELWWVGEE